jgi:Domain of unknown function (DUF397)
MGGEMDWKKSSMCKADQPMCAEVMKHPNGSRSIRNSTNPEIFIVLNSDEWEAFVQGVKNDEF